MSQTFDPENPEQNGGENEGRVHGAPGSAAGHGPGYPYGYPAPHGYPAPPARAGGSWYGGATGAPGGPPMPPRRSHKRGLIATGVVALAAGAALGGLIGSMDHTAAGAVTATSKTMLSASQIAARVDPALVDVVSTDGYQGASSAGTGIVLTSTGEILTNNHVIEGATSIKVTDIGNGKTHTATVVGYDPSHDVAVIQLQNASGLTVANLGDSSSVQTGDSVTALGNAEGKGGTPSVASGTVTALNQSITASDELSSTDEQLTGLIQSNAPIEPGDSGGSLVNAYGQVVGIDTAASSQYQFQGQASSSDAATQAYSIPINEAVSLADQIESGTATGSIHIGATAFMGVAIYPSGSSSSLGSGGLGSGGLGSGGLGSGGYGTGGSGSGSSGQSTTSGASLQEVVQGSPAAKAGLAGGDTITSLAGQTVTSSESIQQILVKYHPGETIQVGWVDAEGQ